MAKSLEEHVQEFLTRGYTIVEGVLNKEELATTNAALESIFEAEKEIGPLRNWHNDTYKVAYMIPQKHPHFRSFCLNPRILPLIQMLLGKSCILASLNGLTMTPGGNTQQLHIDQNETIPNAVLYINALHTLDDFTKENGCTRVVPGSHNRVFNRRTFDHEAAEKEVVYLEAPAGSMIAYNGGLWHAGSANKTNKPRRAIHPFFQKPWLRPQWDYTRSFSPDVAASLSVEQRRLFGFFAQPGWLDPVRNEEVRPR